MVIVSDANVCRHPEEILFLEIPRQRDVPIGRPVDALEVRPTKTKELHSGKDWTKEIMVS